MKKIKRIITLLLILTNTVNSFSQEETKNIIFSISPQYIFVNGMRFDVEYKLKNSWLGVAPTIYYSNSGEFFDGYYEYDYYSNNYQPSYDTITGFGVELCHKFFLQKNETPQGFYFSYGLNYNLFTMRYHTYNWETTLEDGLEYINYTPTYKGHKINKFGANIIIGYEYELSTNLFLDLYTGVGMRFAIQEKDILNTEKFNSSSIDYGYSGPLLLLGFKLGVKL